MENLSDGGIVGVVGGLNAIKINEKGSEKDDDSGDELSCEEVW